MDFRTRLNLIDHLTEHHPSGTPGAKEVPAVHELEVLIGRPRQTLFCPHPYCLFLVKNVASTRSLARHFLQDHPKHDIVFKFKCARCDCTVAAGDRSTHVCGPVTSGNGAPDPVSDGVSISLVAGDDFASPPASVGLRLAPHPRYHLPSSPPGLASPSTMPATPPSQLPPSQLPPPPPSGSQVHADWSSPCSLACSSPYDIPPSSSVRLISPTSSFDSLAEVPSGVRDSATPPSPSPAPPSHQLASDIAHPTPRPFSLEVKVAVSPPGSPCLSDPLADCTPASNFSGPCPPVCQIYLVDAVKSSSAVCSPLSTDPPSTTPPAASCPSDQPASPDLPPSSPASWLSVSPSDSPLQRQLLIGPSPPPAVIPPDAEPPPDVEPPPGRPPQSLRFPRRVLPKYSLPTTKRLSQQRLSRKRLSQMDLRHHLIAGAVPCNDVVDDAVEADSRSCYLKGHHDLIVKLKTVCQDSDTSSPPPSPSPPPVADVRRVVVLKKLGMMRRYKSLFCKLCCSDAIQGSNDIYRLHLGCDDSVPGISSSA